MSWRIRKEGGRQLATDGTFCIKDDFIKMDKNFKKYCEKMAPIVLLNTLFSCHCSTQERVSPECPVNGHLCEKVETVVCGCDSKI